MYARKMDKKDWKIGDVVKLRSGGPKMTVINVPTDSSGDVFCVWFPEGGTHPVKDSFPPEALFEPKM
jgi:uncharacterized protein YodC (DUF2158 family)